MRLTKLHALGNDFLVHLHDDPPDRSTDAPAGSSRAELARAVCDRRRGVGADGLFDVVRRADGTVAQVLTNADGSPAEMSGNGIRCVALALWRAGWWDPNLGAAEISTVVGPRTVTYVDGDRATARFRVAMGPVTVGERGTDGTGTWMVDVGNPHEVHLLAGDRAVLAEVDMAGVARDRNVEFVTRTGPDEIALRVHERGAGETEACGTGSCASAAVARAAGWVGDVVTVHNPGGSVEVDLSGPQATLTGEAVHVAEIEWSARP